MGALLKCIGLSFLSLVSFWCQSVVTEERYVENFILKIYRGTANAFCFFNRLVPALNVISDYYGIPDDIAGPHMFFLSTFDERLYLLMKSISLQ